MRSPISPLVLAVCLLVLQPTIGRSDSRSSPPRRPVSVVVGEIDFQNVDGFEPDTGVLLAQLLMIELARTSRAVVLERAALDALLDEAVHRASGRLEGGADHGSNQPSRLRSADVLVGGKAFSLGDRLAVSLRVTEVESGLVRAIVYEGSPKKRIEDLARELCAGLSGLLANIQKGRVDSSPSAATQTQPDASSPRAPQRRPLRVFLAVSEAFLSQRPERSIVHRRLAGALRDSGERVLEPTDETVDRPSAVLPPPGVEVASWLKGRFPQADVVILGHAQAQPGVRTGQLMSAGVQLTLHTYDVHTGEQIQAIERYARAHDASVASAVEEALRRVAQEAIDALGPTIGERAP